MPDPAGEFAGVAGRLPFETAIVTWQGEGESPRSITADSCTAVSLDPPMLAVSLEARRGAPGIQVAGAFQVNLGSSGDRPAAFMSRSSASAAAGVHQSSRFAKCAWNGTAIFAGSARPY
mgnify:CR=1 FL=1